MAGDDRNKGNSIPEFDEMLEKFWKTVEEGDKQLEKLGAKLEAELKAMKNEQDNRRGK